MKKWLSIFLVLAVLALFGVGCAGVLRSSAGFTSDENPGFSPNQQRDLNWYQIHGY